LPASLLLLEQLGGFVLSLSNLLVQNFLLLVSELHQLSNLFVHQFLLDFLFGFESFGLLGLLKMLKSLLLGGVLLDALFFLLLFDGDFLLYLEQFIVCPLELSSGLGCPLFALNVSQLLPLKLLFDLLFDELALELLLLHFLDVV